MNLTVYTISDTTGYAISHMSKHSMARFDVEFKDVLFQNITGYDSLKYILQEIKKTKGKKIIFHSLQNPLYNEYIRNFSNSNNIVPIDFFSYSLNKISNYLNISPNTTISDEMVYNFEHFRRLDALDFAIKYDDGRDFEGLKFCDIAIIGVSRTSKTPLSVYLASIGYKVSNVPILIDSKVPKELFEIDSEKIFGLTIDKYKLQKIREERLRSINLSSDSKYSDMNRIEKELQYALEIMHDIDCNIIDITYKSIEETSEFIISRIEKTIKERKNYE